MESPQPQWVSYLSYNIVFGYWISHTERSFHIYFNRIYQIRLNVQPPRQELDLDLDLDLTQIVRNHQLNIL